MAGERRAKKKLSFGKYAKEMAEAMSSGVQMQGKAKEMCSQIVIHMANKLAKDAVAYVHSASKTKKTCQLEDIRMAVVSDLLSGIGKKCESAGQKAASSYQASAERGGKMKAADRAGITLPPARFGKILKAHAGVNGRVSPSAIVFLAGVCDCLLEGIIRRALNGSMKEKGVSTISDAHIHEAVRSDAEVADFLKDLSFAGVADLALAQEIHSNLVTGKQAKEDAQRGHKAEVAKKAARQNLVDRRQIHALEKTGLSGPHAATKRLIKNHLGNGYRVQPAAVGLIQSLAEDSLVQIFSGAKMAMGGKQATLKVQHIDSAIAIADTIRV